MNDLLNVRSLKTLSRRYRRRIFEYFGSDRYSKPGLFGLNKKLESYLPSRGFFIEVGANDGFDQSNTYYLERFKGWNGILIEPIPELYRDCVGERPNSKIFNCALVSHDYPDSTIEMKYGHLMSLVKDSLPNSELEDTRLNKAKSWYNIKPYEVTVRARTLTSILSELQVTDIDLFSLDVEGFELNVLKGLDFNKYRPKYMIIEFLDSKSREEIEAYISHLYTFVIKLSKRDYLYKSKN